MIDFLSVLFFLFESLTLSFFSPHCYACCCAGVGSNSPQLSTSCTRPHAMVNGQKSLELCSHSPDGRQPSPLTSPLLNDACSVRTDDEDEVRRKVCCFPAFIYLAYLFFKATIACSN